MSDAKDLVEHVRRALHNVIDPEIGFNIVDIGLVYDIAVEEGGIATIIMTTTTRGCPATNYLRDGAGEAAQTVDGVHGADVQLTYEPPWTPNMMSPLRRNISGLANDTGTIRSRAPSGPSAMRRAGGRRYRAVTRCVAEIG